MATEMVFHRIEVRRSGRRFGNLWLGKQGIQWKGSGKRSWANITWGEFDKFMAKRAEELGQHRWKLE